MVDRIEVFLSSRQEEFQAERQRLQKKISKIPFLLCKPLENRGAIPKSAPEASIKAVGRSHIYLGIFGMKYSRVTRMEYNAAFRKYKPCFIYVKNVNERENKLTRFLDERVEPQFKMCYFETSSELCKMIRQNLEEYLVELLQMGLDSYKEEQKKAINADRASRKRLAKAITEGKENVPFQMLAEAKKAISIGDFVSAIVKSSISAETWLRLTLIKAGVSEDELKGRALGFLMRLSMEKELLSSYDVSLLREVQYMRNRVVHEGITPTKKQVKWAVKTVSAVIKEANRK